MNLGRMDLRAGIVSLLGNRRGHAFALILFYVLLLVEYYRFVYGNYFFLMGFDFRFSPVAFLSGLLMLVAVVAMLDAVGPRSDRLYAMGVVVAVFFCLPQIVFFQIGGAQPYGVLYSLLLLFLVTTPWWALPSPRMPRLPDRCLWWLLPLLALGTMAPFVATYGFSFNLHQFTLGQGIYEARTAAGAKGTVVTAYLMGPLVRVILPFMAVYGLCRLRRRWWMVALSLAITLYLFFVNPQKSILFIMGLVVVCFFLRNCFAKAGLIIYGLLTICAASVVLNSFAGAMMPESIMVRRLFFIPALVQDTYFTFFEHHPMLLSHSCLSPLFDYPYRIDPSHLIGQMIYNRTITSCNTGLIGDGFMNFGQVGALLFTATAALIIRFVDATCFDSRYFGLVAVLLVTFLNGALFTTMLTHGGLLLVLAFLFLVPSRAVTNPVKAIPQT